MSSFINTKTTLLSAKIGKRPAAGNGKVQAIQQQKLQQKVETLFVEQLINQTLIKPIKTDSCAQKRNNVEAGAGDRERQRERLKEGERGERGETGKLLEKVNQRAS